MDSIGIVNDDIIKVDVVQMTPNDGTGECLWNYTELGEMRTVESSVIEKKRAKVPVLVWSKKDLERKTEEVQNSLTLETLCDSPKMQVVNSLGQLDNHKSAKTQNAILTKRCQGTLQEGLESKPEPNIQSDLDLSSVHKKTFACPICNARYAHNPSLIRHKRIHSGERPFVCTVCKKDFVHNTHLIFHMRTHTGEKPFECPRCDRKFSQQGTLIIHLRTHTGERPFECSICKKSFATKSQLTVHLLVHSNDKPFKCPVCDWRFSRRSYLIEHLQTHTGNKPHECSICQKGFSRRKFFEIHMQSHTNEK